MSPSAPLLASSQPSSQINVLSFITMMIQKYGTLYHRKEMNRIILMEQFNNVQGILDTYKAKYVYFYVFIKL